MYVQITENEDSFYRNPAMVACVLASIAFDNSDYFKAFNDTMIKGKMHDLGHNDIGILFHHIRKDTFMSAELKSQYRGLADKFMNKARSIPVLSGAYSNISDPVKFTSTALKYYAFPLRIDVPAFENSTRVDMETEMAIWFHLVCGMLYNEAYYKKFESNYLAFEVYPNILNTDLDLDLQFIITNHNRQQSDTGTRIVVKCALYIIQATMKEILNKWNPFMSEYIETHPDYTGHWTSDMDVLIVDQFKKLTAIADAIRLERRN